MQSDLMAEAMRSSPRASASLRDNNTSCGAYTADNNVSLSHYHGLGRFILRAISNNK